MIKWVQNKHNLCLWHQNKLNVKAKCHSAPTHIPSCLNYWCYWITGVCRRVMNACSLSVAAADEQNCKIDLAGGAQWSPGLLGNHPQPLHPHRVRSFRTPESYQYVGNWILSANTAVKRVCVRWRVFSCTNTAMLSSHPKGFCTWRMNV